MGVKSFQVIQLTFQNANMAHPLPDEDEVRLWSGQDVTNWLNQANLGECVQAFETRRIDGAALMELTEQQLVFMSTDLKVKHRVQLTKYINQCKERDLTLKSAKKKILAITQIKKTVQTPPPVPTVDYNRFNQFEGEDESDRCWGSDFDDESDCDDCGDVNWNDESYMQEEVPQNEFTRDVTTLTQPEVPQRRHKKMVNGDKITKRPEVPQKPPVANKPQLSVDVPAVKSAPATSPSGMPRPPSGLPAKPIQRPTSQPPPPPTGKNQLPELADSKRYTGEEYEIPLPCNSSSSASDSGSMVRSASSVTSESDNASSGSSSTYSDQPTLPPRFPNSKPGAPPVPRRPSAVLSNECQRSPSEKQVLLPRRTSDDKTDVRQLKTIGVIKQKITTLLHSSDKTSKTDSSSSHGGSKASTPEHSVAASMSNLCQDQNQHTTSLTRTRSQDTIGSSKENRVRVHRISLDQGATMQDRPLPPVPGGHQPVSNVLEQLYNCTWFHPVERYAAEQMLGSMTETGSYLVRQSRRAGEGNPYTLNILFDGKVFHLNIRRRSDGMFALGKEKPKEKTFSTVEDLINYHQNEPILLTTKGTVAGKTCLVATPPKQ